MASKDNDPRVEEPEFGLGFTLAVILGPVGFFGVYLAAFTLPGFRTYLGAAAMVIFAALSYVGLAFVGTRWFARHRGE